MRGPTAALGTEQLLRQRLFYIEMLIGKLLQYTVGEAGEGGKLNLHIAVGRMKGGLKCNSILNKKRRELRDCVL